MADAVRGGAVVCIGVDEISGAWCGLEGRYIPTSVTRVYVGGAVDGTRKGIAHKEDIFENMLDAETVTV